MTRAFDKEKSESPTGIEPMTSRKPVGRSIHWAKRTHGEQGHFLSSHVTGVLHTARISTAEFIMSSDKWMKMVNFELGNFELVSRTLQPGLSVVLENLTTLHRSWKNFTGYLLKLSYTSVTPCSLLNVWLAICGRTTISSQLLHIPLYKSKSGQRAFFYRVVSLWNSLDNSLKLCPPSRNFRHKLRAKLFAAQFLSSWY